MIEKNMYKYDNLYKKGFLLFELILGISFFTIALYCIFVSMQKIFQLHIYTRNIMQKSYYIDHVIHLSQINTFEKDDSINKELMKITKSTNIFLFENKIEKGAIVSFSDRELKNEVGDIWVYREKI